jgi:hypothetical protein
MLEGHRTAFEIDLAREKGTSLFIRLIKKPRSQTGKHM